MQRLLQGIMVVEASRSVAARYCGRLFAQFGASVVRARGGDDGAIGYGGAAGEAYGRWLDAGKSEGSPERRVDLVLSGPDGEAPPDPAPGATLLAFSWFHPGAPYARTRASDETIHAHCGIAYPFGEREGPPTIAQGHGPQLVAGLTGFNAAVAALMARPRPKRIDLNVFEAFMTLTETGACSAFHQGGGSVRLGVNRFVPTYPCQSYRTADGWIGVSTLTPAQWRGLCDVIRRPDLAHEPRYASVIERLMLADEIDAILNPVFLARTTDEWLELTDAARVPVTPMPTLSELLDAPHWRRREAFGAFDTTAQVGPTLPFRMALGGPRRPFAAGDAEAPLKGLKVVDFSMGWAGPLCTRTLGDLGADVVKVESASHPDWWRGWEDEAPGDAAPRETKFNFIAMNRNKRGVALELATPEGLAAAKALIARADVVVENFAAGVMDKLGLGPDVRRALNPGLISVSMPAFGNGGPLSAIRAYGSTVEQASGLPFVNGRAEWVPCLQHVAYGDPLAGLFAAAAVLSALNARGESGGAEIDLAQVACLFQFGADAIIAQQFGDEPLPRLGNRRTRAAPVCVVAGLEHDSWLAVAVDGPQAWRGLCGVLGQGGWADDATLATVQGRNARAEEIEAEIAAWSSLRDPDEAAALLQAAGVAATRVRRVDELGYDPQLADGGFWVEMERAFVGRHVIPATPFAYDGRRPALRFSAPTLGQHTEEVLGELRAEAR